MASLKLILVGGFLGAGKTTLLARATERLLARGERVGLVTNDQVAGLVDTSSLRQRGYAVHEVAGGCFCCRYLNLVEAIDALEVGASAGVVLGEPVGSCTDIAATVVRPLRAQFGARFRIAPFTVVADALRLRDLLDGGAWASEPRGAVGQGGPRAAELPGDVLYIYRKQLEEADVVALNKLDLLTEAETARLRRDAARAFPQASICALSARTGEGVTEWLESVLAGGRAGAQVVPVDYDRYAEGEAALGWLNVTLEVETTVAPDWLGLQVALLEALRLECVAEGAEIAHVKAATALPHGTLVASLTTTSGQAEAILIGQPDLRAARARLVVNARVHMTPEALDAAFGRAWRAASGREITFRVTERAAIRPGRPQPVHRGAEAPAV